jgi:FlaA1/EpsC-like NDP-sugar epimerase
MFARKHLPSSVTAPLGQPPVPFSDEKRRPLVFRTLLAGAASQIGKSMFRASPRRLALYAFDLTLCGAALIASSLLRSGASALDSPEQLLAIPIFVTVCGIVLPLSGLYNKHWRYATALDLVTIIKAVVISSFILVAVMFLTTRLESFPRSVVAIEVFVLICLLSAVRLCFRIDDLRSVVLFFTPSRAAENKLHPILLVGAGGAADLYLRALQRDPQAAYQAVGILEDAPSHRGLTLRGVPILGARDDFETVLSTLASRGQYPRHLVFTDSLRQPDGRANEHLIERAEKLGITVSRLPSPTELRQRRASEGGLELRPIELTDLLERPQTALNHAVLEQMITGRRVVVTGAGGSIGGELTQQIAALRPAELVLIENSEYNLYNIDLELSEKHNSVPRVCYLCNVRDADRVNEIFDRHQPELVFHAAALKHVPMVELNPCEGVLTNVIGTMHVAEAAKRVKSLGMVQISTDKVVNPTSVMGATKRLAELFCQALDLDGIANLNDPRFMTVRFGNVLGSSGSLIPLFKRQLARGGPLTVTDLEMRRFFMTVREAVELTLQASAFGLQHRLGQGEIFVLDMGEPIKIIDIARRMIRLAGYTPDHDIKIDIVGARPGEKLFEELFDSSERRVDSAVPGVLGAAPDPVPLALLRSSFSGLRRKAEIGDVDDMFQIISRLLPKYQRATVRSSKSGEPDQVQSAAAA